TLAGAVAAPAPPTLVGAVVARPPVAAGCPVPAGPLVAVPPVAAGRPTLGGVVVPGRTGLAGGRVTPPGRGATGPAGPGPAAGPLVAGAKVGGVTRLKDVGTFAGTFG